MDLKKLIDTAMSREKADLVLKGAKVLNVFTERLEEKDVAISGGRIAGLGRYDGKSEIYLNGKIIVPGFMDAHIHLESSLLTPSEFERISLPHGTVAVMADPHEIANVAGTEGIDYMMKLCENLSMRVYFNMPSCVPAAPLEESGETLEAEDISPYYTDSRVLGLAEVMNSNGVSCGDEKLLKKIIDARGSGKIIDGHAPFLGGKDLCAYTAAGVCSDHECTDAGEAIEKIAGGQWIMVREGTAAKNLKALLPICKPPYCSRAMFCTDDRHPGDLIRQGHIDAILRKAVAWGVDPFIAVKMCTINTAAYFGLKDRGAVSPGYHADLAVIDNLTDFNVERVFIDGRQVAESGKMLIDNTAELPDSKKILHSFNLSKISVEDLAVPEIKRFQRVIGLRKHELLTDEIIIQPTLRGRQNSGIDVERDILKAAVFERHHNTGHTGVGFITGYGIKEGAIATSVAHDSHNLIVIGTNDNDIAVAAETVRECEGGLVAVKDGKVLECLPLPIVGLMSPLSAEEVDRKLKSLKKAAKALGASHDIDAFMTLAFVSLPVIPKLRLNGKGLIDVINQKIVDITF